MRPATQEVTGRIRVSVTQKSQSSSSVASALPMT